MGNKITGIWLITGRRLVVTSELAVTEKGFIIRDGDKKILIVPPQSIVSVETEYETVEEVDKLFRENDSN